MPEEGTGATAAATAPSDAVVAPAAGGGGRGRGGGAGRGGGDRRGARQRVVGRAARHPGRARLPQRRRVLAAMDSKGAVCSGAGQAGQFADCSADSNGDTVIGLFSDHADALAYADGMVTLGLQLHTPTAEVVGPNWVVNTSPAFADEVVDAIGGQVITKANAQGSPEAEQWSVRYGGF